MAPLPQPNSVHSTPLSSRRIAHKPKPTIIAHKPSIIAHKPSIIVHKPSTPPSTHKPSTPHSTGSSSSFKIHEVYQKDSTK